MFPLVPNRKVRRLARRSAAQAGRTLKAAARAAETAMRQTAKAALAASRAAEPRPARTERAPAGRFVTVDGLRVHVIVRGRGRPVVLIHGNGTMAEDYAICGLIDRLAERYRVIALDRPGFGRTDRPRLRAWTAAAQAALVGRVLDALNVERPLVLGHSWGTLVALALAAEGRRDLRGLVLLAGYYFPQLRADVTLAKPFAVPILGDAARAAVPGPVNRALAEQSFRQVFRPQPVPARFTARFPVEIAAAPTQLRAVAEDAAALNATAAWLQTVYPRLTLPVEILTGDADGIVDPAAQSMRLHAALPGSRLTVLPGLGHMIHYGGRAKVERAVDRLMAPPTGRGGRGAA
ncbi:alpha/beta hydrolase [Methylobacterium sp. NEAU 140]|nr:alpha/beta hydrolase [Methylobacterium sp. NEAU 140]MDP4022399.1 alpha/beta hydrolase [Methylobacterium sp. NEAU 140]